MVRAGLAAAAVALLLAGCVGEDAIAGRRLPAPVPAPDRDYTQIGDQDCKGIINTDEYSDCRREAGPRRHDRNDANRRTIDASKRPAA